MDIGQNYNIILSYNRPIKELILLDILQSQELIEETINKNDMVLVYFGNKTCGVCVDMKPKVEEILEKYPGIKSIYVDMERFPGIGIKYSIFTIPAILFFTEGKETLREARYISIKDIDMKISRYYDLIM